MFAVVLMTLLVFGVGTGLAWNLTPNNRAFIAADDRGDLLYNQLYLALPGGWQTDIWVGNMSLNRSIVAKLLVRSGKYSQDIRNIMIYFTPGDIVRLTLYYNAADGLVYLYSEDGSVRNTDDTGFASAASPLNINLLAPGCDDTREYGYVVIQEVAYSQWANAAGSTNLASSALTTPATVRGNYSAAVLRRFAYGGFCTRPPLPFAGALYTAGGVWDGNWLTGYTEIRNNTLGLTSGATTMTVIADYQNTAFQFNTENIRIGANARNNLTEVESILATTRTDLPYVNNATDGVSLITHAFPTKYAWRWWNRVDCIANPAVASPSEFFEENTRAVGGVVRHMQYSLNMNETLKSSPFSPERPFLFEVNGTFTDVAHDSVLFSAEMDMGYVITRFDQLGGGFITQGCRDGYATDYAGFNPVPAPGMNNGCPNDDPIGVWARVYVDTWGVAGPVIDKALPVVVGSLYIQGTPAQWDLASVINPALYPPTAWPNWVGRVVAVATAEDMTQLLYGISFDGAPANPLELRFGGQSFSLMACSRSQSTIATTTDAPGGTPTPGAAGLVGPVGSNVASGG